MDFLSKRPKLSLTTKEDTVEYGEKLDLKSYIESSSVDDIFISEFDPFTVGKQEITFSAIRNGETLEVALILNVVDSKSPSFSTKAEEILIVEGDAFEPSYYFKASDPIDGEVDVSIKEDLDTEKLGMTLYTVIAEDKNGNQNSVTFNLVVKGKDEVAAIEENLKPEVPDTPSSQEKPQTQAPPSTNQTPTEKPKPAPSQPSNKADPHTKEFLLSQGYVNDPTAGGKDVTNACAVYISKFPNNARACRPIYEGRQVKGQLAVIE
ncbi:hypothetical protein G7059_03660 [Erysipelothrix sp. HDW6A]|uniref:hypothetical protein n=1 Tax=Erysipelothrix sp. HDW6A TaxID=2714928 RepID=UPI00140D0871|nr:hypothetical protein [Erysipelothrix sp. HDW6A]QIK57008.1 hypothetical protein G7059_03660 [Erysipelothrix sp. HDW6A]